MIFMQILFLSYGFSAVLLYLKEITNLWKLELWCDAPHINQKTLLRNANTAQKLQYFLISHNKGFYWLQSVTMLVIFHYITLVYYMLTDSMKQSPW